MRAAAILLITACGGGSTPAPDSRTLVAELPATANPNLDLVFVIDDSGGTAEMQANLAAALPAMFDRLSGALPGGQLPDLHVGVVTSDLGTATGTSSPGPDIGTVGQGGCSGRGKNGAFTVGQAGITDTFISDIAATDGTRQRNYDGELGTVLGQTVVVGAGGCGFEQPLASLRAALDNNPANAGFRRPDAALAVFILMDEDDCSVHDPTLFGPDTIDNALQSFRCTRFGVICDIGGRTTDEMNQVGEKGECHPNRDPAALVENVDGFHEFLLGLVDDPRHLLIGGLFGNPSPFGVESRTINGQPQPALAHSCQVTQDDLTADPGVRLQAFAETFPDRFATGSMCNNDLSEPIQPFAQLLAFGIGTPCVSSPVADVGTCVVEDHLDTAITPIAACDQVDREPCWELIDDLATCRLAEHLRLNVRRPAPPDPRTVTTMRCVVD